MNSLTLAVDEHTQTQGKNSQIPVDMQLMGASIYHVCGCRCNHIPTRHWQDDKEGGR